MRYACAFLMAILLCAAPVQMSNEPPVPVIVASKEMWNENVRVCQIIADEQKRNVEFMWIDGKDTIKRKIIRPKIK